MGGIGGNLNKVIIIIIAKPYQIGCSSPQALWQRPESFPRFGEGFQGRGWELGQGLSSVSHSACTPGGCYIHT